MISRNYIIIILILVIVLCWLSTVETFVPRPALQTGDQEGLFLGDLPASRTGKCFDTYSSSLGAICGGSKWVAGKMGEKQT